MSSLELNIAKPLLLPCGLKLPNRLVRAALTEQWSDHKTLLPTEELLHAYELWAAGGWGMVITGNVFIDPEYMGSMKDPAFSDLLSREELLAAWRRWAKLMHKSGSPAVMQLNHPGRQSPAGGGTRGYFAKAIAPSPVPVALGPGYIAKAISAIAFGTPREMTTLEIKLVVERFAHAANLAAEAGFDGVQIHGAHGYLLTQFLSEKTNQRNDEYGGSPKKRARIVVEVIKAMKALVPKGFCIGIKINSVDHQSPSELQDCLEQLNEIVHSGIDFLEISGGSYEDPTMLDSTASQGLKKASANTVAREAFFLEFAETIRKTFPKVHLMVTGGFRSRLGMENAVSGEACDMVGIGRPAILEPGLPKTVVFNSQIPDEEARLQTKSFHRPWLAAALGVKGLGGGQETVGALNSSRL
ncbi:Aldolase-type TIM barrel [Beauveria brongniartii RCEF 3172]|uniref:Aldolase-type TIM barrel n=1 Tax=Beauveria brongniartii RCEF 3172 TaxID=1081107 RepID=A0A166W8W4_9HYPO|nr:Aldolase-type TIM barrel [Beauveria brongniartii RCEF 3172]